MNMKNLVKKSIISSLGLGLGLLTTTTFAEPSDSEIYEIYSKQAELTKSKITKLSNLQIYNETQKQQMKELIADWDANSDKQCQDKPKNQKGQCLSELAEKHLSEFWKKFVDEKTLLDEDAIELDILTKVDLLLSIPVYKTVLEATRNKDINALAKVLHYPTEFCLNDKPIRINSAEELVKNNIKFKDVISDADADLILRFGEGHRHGIMIGWRGPLFGDETGISYDSDALFASTNLNDCYKKLSIKFCSNDKYNNEIKKYILDGFTYNADVDIAKYKSKDKKYIINTFKDPEDATINGKQTKVNRVKESTDAYPIFTINEYTYTLIGEGDAETDVCQGSGCFTSVPKVVMLLKEKDDNCTRIELYPDVDDGEEVDDNIDTTDNKEKKDSKESSNSKYEKDNSKDDGDEYDD